MVCVGHTVYLRNRSALYPLYMYWRTVRSRSSVAIERAAIAVAHTSLSGTKQRDLIRMLGVVTRIMAVLGSTYRPEMAQFRDVYLATTEFDEFYYLSADAADTVTPALLPHLGCPELPDPDKGVVIPAFTPHWLFSHLVVTYAKVAAWVAVADSAGMAVVVFTAQPEEMPEGKVIEI